MAAPEHDERWYFRPEARAWRCPDPDNGALAFHAGLPGYAVTSLTEAPRLAVELGVGRVFVKDESSRLGLPAFKVLGVSWAVYRALSQRAGAPIEPATIDRLREVVAAGPPIELVAATDGNHGRALARISALIGAQSRIFVPERLPAKVIAAIEGEGARVVRVNGTYDDGVQLAAEAADQSPDALLIQDTAWPGYEVIPAWAVAGYTTLFLEADAQLREAGVDSPDLVSVPVGVGSLMQAALAHYRREGIAVAPSVLSVEPEVAACALASVKAGALTEIETSDTIMAGLNCGVPSLLAWPFMSYGLDAAVAVSDDMARTAMDDLAANGVPAGPSGAASLAGVRAVLGDPQRRVALALGPDAVLLLICTEGRASGAA